MERENIVAELRRILISVFKHEDFEMKDELSANDVEGWDSLNHMLIITEIENKFGIKFKLRDLNKLNNLGNLIELVASKIDQR